MISDLNRFTVTLLNDSLDALGNKIQSSADYLKDMGYDLTNGMTLTADNFIEYWKTVQSNAYDAIKTDECKFFFSLILSFSILPVSNKTKK